jgi:hypothetical protein
MRANVFVPGGTGAYVQKEDYYQRLICYFTYDDTGGTILIDYSAVVDFINSHYSRKVALSIVSSMSASGERRRVATGRRHRRLGE